MPVIKIIAMFVGAIAFINVFASTKQLFEALPDTDSEALTNRMFSTILCFICVGVVAYAEAVKIN
jgi:hypothetical protein